MWLVATVLDSTILSDNSQILKSESSYSRSPNQFITKECNLLSEITSKMRLQNVRLGALDYFFSSPRNRVIRTFPEVGKT